jgi:hypothetical protein
LDRIVAAVLDTGRAVSVHGNPRDVPRRLIVDIGSIASAGAAAGMHADTRLALHRLGRRDIVGTQRTAIRCEAQTGPCYVRNDAVFVHFRSITMSKDGVVVEVDYMTTDRRRESSATCTWRVRAMFLNAGGRIIPGQVVPLRRC